MSSDQCAACGKSDGPLKKCSACRSVRYCCVDCQRSHRPEHKTECKRCAKVLKLYGGDREQFERILEARKESIAAIEANDPDDPHLFEHSPMRECAICNRPLPFENLKELHCLPCCGQLTCTACLYENERVIRLKNTTREDAMRHDPNYEPNSSPPIHPGCPFCRSAPHTVKAYIEQLQKRIIENNDAFSMFQLAGEYISGNLGVEQDIEKYVDLMHRAAELGSMDACHKLARHYCHGAEGLNIEKDLVKMFYYEKKAAKMGHPRSRYELGVTSYNAGLVPLAYHHFIIAASCGEDLSFRALGWVSPWFEGRLSETTILETTIAYEKAKDEMKSIERDRVTRANYDFREYCRLHEEEEGATKTKEKPSEEHEAAPNKDKPRC